MIVALQLDEDMESMARLKDGMKIKAHVLEVCRVMVRAEKAEHRLAILKIIQVLPHSAEAVMRIRSQWASGRVLLCVVLCCVFSYLFSWSSGAQLSHAWLTPCVSVCKKPASSIVIPIITKVGCGVWVCWNLCVCV